MALPSDDQQRAENFQTPMQLQVLCQSNLFFDNQSYGVEKSHAATSVCT
jgi:hypothetical protein